MGKYTDEALRMRPYLVDGAQSLNDADALKVKTVYFFWKDLIGKKVKIGYKFRHGDKLYKTKQPEYTFVEHYEPGTPGTESLFEVINETHAGTIDAPIPYSGNMALEKGKYYEQYDVIYLCTRDIINPVYSDLSALVGIYVEEVPRA